METLTALILGVAYLGKEAVADAAKRILGPTWDVVGTKVKNGLFGPNLQAVVTEASQTVLDAGHEPQPVPGRILMPLLEHASWEDEPDLHRMWVGLLANAALPTDENSVLPAYAEILRQLVPVQARVLQWMYVDLKRDHYNLASTWDDAVRADIEDRFELTPQTYALLVSDLERLQLIEPREEVPQIDNSMRTDVLIQFLKMRAAERVKYNKISLTVMSLNLLRSCTPPPKVR